MTKDKPASAADLLIIEQTLADIRATLVQMTTEVAANTATLRTEIEEMKERAVVQDRNTSPFTRNSRTSRPLVSMGVFSRGGFASRQFLPREPGWKGTSFCGSFVGG